MTTGVRKTGDFCWINMLTSQPAEEQAFFSKILGWTYTDMGGMGSSIRVDGREIGGMFDLAGPNTPPGTPPSIGVMVKVDNADAMVQKFISLGGSARPAWDVMGEGRMSVCSDPNGAEIDIWQPKSGHGIVADTGTHGAPSWFENYTTSIDKATKFYAELFGWTPEVMKMPGMDYTMFKLGDVPIAGMMAITDEMGSMPPHWATYFTVTDPDEAGRKAEELGGKIVMGPHDIPNVGRFCGLTSPKGVMFFVIRYLPRN